MVDSTTGYMNPPSFDAINDDMEGNIQVENDIQFLRFVEFPGLIHSARETIEEPWVVRDLI